MLQKRYPNWVNYFRRQSNTNVHRLGDTSSEYYQFAFLRFGIYFYSIFRTYYSNTDLSSHPSLRADVSFITNKDNFYAQPHAEFRNLSRQGSTDYYKQYDVPVERVRSPSLPPINRIHIRSDYLKIYISN